jgi:hypothetical protein
MPFQLSSRLLSVLGSVLAAGLLLTVASCSHGATAPAGQASTPSPAQLRSSFVLEAVRSQAAMPAGGCPAGSVALSGGPGQCYQPLGAPVTITSAVVGPVITGALRSPGLDGFWIVLPRPTWRR